VGEGHQGLGRPRRLTQGTGARYLSVAGFAEGVRLSAPAIPVMALFGAAYGAFAAQKGLALLEATLMSTLMFAGASQFVATEMWAEPMTVSLITTLCLIAAAVNMRFMLMTASLRHWLGGLPAWQTYPALSLLTEPGWLIAMRYRATGGTDHSIVLSSGIALWLVWIASTIAGYLLGAVVADPRRYALDLVMPVFFTVMLVPLWSGPRRAIAWIVAGGVAFATAEFVAGWWYIIAGTVAGTVTAGLIDERV
jgi:branched chain amino acid efflux pump